MLRTAFYTMEWECLGSNRFFLVYGVYLSLYIELDIASLPDRCPLFRLESVAEQTYIFQYIVFCLSSS